MVVEEKQFNHELYLKFLSALSPRLARKYSSLVARIKTIYGEEITLQEFLDISEDEFAAQRGIGALYIERFLRLKEYLLNEQESLLENSPADLNQWDVPVTDVPEQYQYLSEKLRLEYGVQTYVDILNIDSVCFKRLYGVGKKKYELLLRWKKEIHDNPPETMALELLHTYRFDFSYLSKAEKSLITKFVRRGMSVEKVTPFFIMTQAGSELVMTKGFGKKNIEALSSLQKKIYSCFVGNADSQSVLLLKTYGERFALPEISRCLLKDIECFSENLSLMEKTIFTKRMGLHEEQLSLEELGTQFGVTRERIRQRESVLIDELTHSVRIARDWIKPKIKEAPVLTLLSEFQEMRQAFSTDRCFIRMLAYLSGSDEKELRFKINPNIRHDALDDFFCPTPPPASKLSAISFLQEGLGFAEDEAERALLMLAEKDCIEISGESIRPFRVKKEVSIVHLLAGYPEGLNWQQVVEKINAGQTCRVQLSPERSDQVLNSSGYVYQSGRDEYCHMRYFGLSKEEVRYWLDDLKGALEKSEHRAFHLYAEYYALKPSSVPDYYKIRHIARNFGSQTGVYFQGKSRVDTVSLEPDASRIPQKEALARALSKSSMNMEKILHLIQSHSEIHANLYLGELLADGRIVQMEDGSFASPAVVFSGMDVGKMKDIIGRILKQDQRTHHIGTLSVQLNRLMNTDHTPKFCRSMIRAFSSERKWFLRGYLVSCDPLEWRGLSDVVRSAPELQGEDLIAWVQQKVCASRDAIKRAIHNSGVLRAQSENTGYSEGLASDLMQELFEL